MKTIIAESVQSVRQKPELTAAQDLAGDLRQNRHTIYNELWRSTELTNALWKEIQSERLKLKGDLADAAKARRLFQDNKADLRKCGAFLTSYQRILDALP
jgi:hypothetical protein